MARDITHGQVRRNTEANKYAVAVDHLLFPTLAAAGPLPPPGTNGTLTVKTVPSTPYTANQVITYEDGNNNNTLNMTVTSVVGPAKYQVTV